MGVKGKIYGSRSDIVYVEVDLVLGVGEFGNIVGEIVGGYFELSGWCCVNVWWSGVVLVRNSCVRLGELVIDGFLNIDGWVFIFC